MAGRQCWHTPGCAGSRGSLFLPTFPPMCIRFAPRRATQDEIKSSREQLRQVLRGRWHAGKDCFEPAVGEAHVAFQDRRQHGAEVGGDRKIALLIELCWREARPIAVNPAAADGAAQDPDDIAVAVIGAPVAVFPKGTTEFGQDDDDGVSPGLACSREQGRRDPRRADADDRPIVLCGCLG